MNDLINKFLRSIDIYDYLKLFKDKYFKNPSEVEHENKLEQFYGTFIKSGDLCFDIGASYGNRSQTFINLGAKVVALEPQIDPFKFLNRKFKNKIIIENKAVSSTKGKMKMLVSDYSALSSLSPQWVETVSKKRFSGIKWDKTIEVDVVTIDMLIQKYGIPDFCKIDVEGHEYELLKGLTVPIKMLSFEFTIPEFKDIAIDCINYLSSLGKILCNYSQGEKLEFGLNRWLEKEDFISFFINLNDPNIVDGDIYIKFI